jgi:hypothetical protein
MTDAPTVTLSPTVVVLGMTGDGKSNLATYILGDADIFKVSDNAESCTDEPVLKAGVFFGVWGKCSGCCTVMDTPGLSDSGGCDAANLRKTIAMLKEQVVNVIAFVLVVNAQQDRMSAALKNTIKVFRACFGPMWWHNLCVVFTKWDWGKKYGGFTVAKLQKRKAEWTAWFRQCEMEYSETEHVVDAAEIQLFAVDLPPLAMVLEEGGPDEVNSMLEECAIDKFSSTGDQLRALHFHLSVVLASRPAMSMRLAEAKTDNLHEELARQLKAEAALRVKIEEDHRREMSEQKDLREAEQQANNERTALRARWKLPMTVSDDKKSQQSESGYLLRGFKC